MLVVILRDLLLSVSLWVSVKSVELYRPLLDCCYYCWLTIIIFYLQVSNDKSTHRRNNFICIGALAISVAFTIILRIALMLENCRRDHLSPEEYDHEAAIIEPCDWVSSNLILVIFLLLFSCSILKYDTLCDKSASPRT